jgi:hypothetical protein
MWTVRTKKKGTQRTRKAGRNRYPAVRLAVALIAAACSAWAQEYGRFGLAIKSGAAAGPMGIQLAWNLSRSVQLCAGGGGTSDPFAIHDRHRTDSYFMMGKYYLDHIFFETGYAVKVIRSEAIQAEKVDQHSRMQPAIPMHVGYEFGHRRGFYFATSVGYFYAIGGGYALPSFDVSTLTSVEKADSGPTVGLTVGYYLW